MPRRWFPGPEFDPDAALRLFCLPYAGGGASVYHRWRQIAPRHLEVRGVELPGRGSRAGEAPFIRLAPLVKALTGALEAVPDRPFALFGHSLGGLVAFELARALRSRGSRPPVHLFISATRAPGTPSNLPLVHDASTADLKRYLRRLNGTPDTILHSAELMEVMLPILRADFSVLETYEHRAEPPLEVPMTVFGGSADPVVPPSALAGWRRQARVGPRIELFPGDHFYLQHAGPELLARITAALDQQELAGHPLERGGGVSHG